MRMLRFGVIASFVGVVGCGAKSAAEPPPEAPLEAASAEVTAPLTPVAAPAELFAVARISSAAKIADMAVAWSGIPTDWRSLLAKQANGFDRVAVLTAPVDFAAMLDPTATGEPRVVWAFSVGVASTDAAASFFRQNGGQVVSDKGGSHHIQFESDLFCVAAPALGTAVARLVCSDRAERADLLAPYMTRGLPTETFGTSEIHLHATAEPLRRRFGAQFALVRTVGVPFALRELEIDHPKFDRALRDALYGAADELIAVSYDLDRIDMDAATTPDQAAVDASFKLSFIGQRSWSSQVFAQAAGKGGVAPDPFWTLPAAATSAGYSTYANPEHNRGVVASLRELADGWLDYHELSEKRRTALVDSLEKVLLFDAKSVYATLPNPLSAEASPEAQRLRKAYGLGLAGRVVAVDHDGEKVSAFLSELVKSVNDPSFRRNLTKKKIVDAAELPTARERAPKLSKDLPKGARAYEFSVPLSVLDKLEPGKSKAAPRTPDAKGSKEVFKVVVIVATDGPLTWFAWGPEDEQLVAWLNEARSGKATLATRNGLEPLHTEPAISAGFVSAAGVLGDFAARLAGERGVPDENAVQRLPHKGETPMLWRMTVDPQGPVMKAQIRVPREVVEDSVAFAASGIAGSSRSAR